VDRYVIACTTPWFWNAWHRHENPPGEWVEVHHEPLTAELLTRIDPRYVFFPHWSTIVPPHIVENWECVCFHSTPVPYGRGGSPVQNMIARGHSETVVTALRMVEDVDAGPVYLREPISLLGGGDEVFLRIGEVTVGLIAQIAASEPAPTPQEGEIVCFDRRKPAQSRLPADGSLQELFDLIRMLDAQGYPAAFADVGPWRLEFTRAALRLDAIEADVRIRRRDEAEDA
jgi:methionyl-tRNA formyltransferase